MMNSQKIGPKPSALCDTVGGTSWLEVKSYIIEVHLACSCDAYQKKMEENCSRRFTQESVEIMLHQEHWSARLIGKVSSGRLLSQMQTKSSTNVRDASILLGRYTCQRRSCRLSRSLGILQSGVSTWSAPCRECRVVTHTSSSPSTSSPSGLKPNLSPRSQLPRQRNSSKTL